MRLKARKASHQVFAEHLGEECASGLAVAVFSGEGAAVGEGDVGGAVDELAEIEDAGGGFEVEVEAHVDAALAEVAVHCGGVVVLVDEGVDGAEVAAELRGVDGGVFPALPAGGGFSVRAGDEGGGAEAGLADVPDALGLVGGVDAGGGVSGKRFHGGHEGAGFGVGFGLSGGAELYDEEAVAGREEFEVFDGFLLAAERVEQIAVDAFETDGFVLEDLGDVVGGEEDVGEANSYEGAALGAFDELERSAEDDGAGAFAADEGSGEVEIVFGE